MTREEAINRLTNTLQEMRAFFFDSKHISEDDEKDLASMEMAIKALEQEPCEDAVSRQAVIELCESWWLGHTKEDDFATEIRALPSVNPQKTGHWIDTGSGQECSECREIQYGYDSFRYFCPNCGAKMIESEVDNAK